MRTTKSFSMNNTFTCGGCSMKYKDYKHLLEHLFWRHGTESFWCQQCSLKRWSYAHHECNEPPFIYEQVMVENDLEENEVDSSYYSERETPFCFCGKFIPDAQMIGCDNPKCALQWFHFACVDVSTVPEGEWFCPKCVSEKPDLEDNSDAGK